MAVSRRGFFRRVGAGALGVAGAAGCGTQVPAARIVDVAINDDPSSFGYGFVAVSTAIYPELVEVGGALTLRLTPLPPGKRPFSVPVGGILLVHRAPPEDPPEYVAVSSVCPHAFCPLGYSARDQLIECPCHGSRFRVVADPADPKSCAGQVVHRPARADLTTWDVENDGRGALFINLGAPQACGQAFPAVANHQVTLLLSDFPALATVGGAVVGRPPGLGDAMIVVRAASDRVVTLSALCTHAGCVVGFSPGDQRLECPCHGSSFSLDGAVRGGPAGGPLESYPTSFDGATVTITVPE